MNHNNKSWRPSYDWRNNNSSPIVKGIYKLWKESGQFYEKHPCIIKQQPKFCAKELNSRQCSIKIIGVRFLFIYAHLYFHLLGKVCHITMTNNFLQGIYFLFNFQVFCEFDLFKMQNYCKRPIVYLIIKGILIFMCVYLQNVSFSYILILYLWEHFGGHRLY